MVALCRLRRVKKNAATLDALHPAPPAHRRPSVEGARALDADDLYQLTALAGGYRCKDLHSQQIAVGACRRARYLLRAAYSLPREAQQCATSWLLALIPSCW